MRSEIESNDLNIMLLIFLSSAIFKLVVHLLLLLEHFLLKKSASDDSVHLNSYSINESSKGFLPSPISVKRKLVLTTNWKPLAN
jgi:hypothetical protein